MINRGRIVDEDEIDRLRGRERLRLEVKGDPQRLVSLVRGLDEVESCTTVTASEGLARAEVTFKEGSDGREAIFGICARESWPILEMSQAAASLEEMFMKITTREVVE